MKNNFSELYSHSKADIKTNKGLEECGFYIDILHPCFLIKANSATIWMSQVMSFFATAEHEKERLKDFASPEGRDDLYQYNQKERRTVLEVSSIKCILYIILL